MTPSQFKSNRLNQVRNIIDRYQLDAKDKLAQTGTWYFTIDRNIKVRVADHSDAYATSDFNIDPFEDEYKAFKRWAIENGEKKDRKIKNKYRIVDSNGVVVGDFSNKNDVENAFENGSKVLMEDNYPNSPVVDWIKDVTEDFS